MANLRRLRYGLSKTLLRAPLVLVRHRGLNPQDVFIGSYPRAGSTWLRFLLFETLSGQSSAFGNVNEYIPDVGEHRTAQPLLPGGGRFIKTHEPYRDEYKKALYLVRDPRDVVLSEYAYHKALGVVGNDFDDYVLSFLRGTVNPFGSWQHHVQTWLQAKTARGRNIRVVKFEDLRRDTAQVLTESLEFLEVPVDPAVIQRAVDDNSVERMREKEKRSPQKASQRGRFIRTGSVGGWRERLTDRQKQLIERCTRDALGFLGYSVEGQGTLDDRGKQELAWPLKA